MIRKPIITVLGHVDSGKTKLLDTIRGTAIMEKEAGGITQHIGATEVPIHLINKLAGDLIVKYKFNITVPGLLFIDTPGHEAFTNLRKRGGSIADLAVLVVDVTKGLQNQTYEALDILRNYKTPFIVAANKIDIIRGWETKSDSFSSNVKKQSADVIDVLDEKIYIIVGQLHEKGFNAERFDRCNDFTKEIPIIPICAKSGEGIAEILMFLAGLSQKYLESRLQIEAEGPGRGTVLEVKEERGLGKTVDVILYNGSIKVGQEIVLGGRSGAIKTKIRALLEPKPLDDIRSPQEKFKNVDEVHAASGVKIAAPNLDETLAGSPIRVFTSESDEKEVMDEIEKVKIDADIVGPVIKTDTLGSLEALVKLLEEKGLKPKRADVGEVSRRDVVEQSSAREEDIYKSVIFAFNTKVSKAVKEEAEKANVKIFEDNVIYKLLEDYELWVNREKEEEKKRMLSELTIPVKLFVLPDYVFRHSKPAIVGVRVETGRLRSGIKVMKKGKIIGNVDNVQSEGKNVDEAKEGDEIAISIDDAVVDRNLFEKDFLYSFIPPEQFDKLYALRDSLSKDELKLLEEIKEIEKEEIEAKEANK